MTRLISMTCTAILSVFIAEAQDETINGRLKINSSADVGIGQTPALLIGQTTGLHIDIDGNEIGAFSNNTNSTLYLNGSQSTSNTIINGDGTGNVGIRTMTPSATLHVNSNSDVGRGQNPALRIGLRNGNHIAIDDNEIGAFNNNSNAVLYINGSQSTSNTIINGDGTGNVGIGTMNPRERFQIGNSYIFHDGGHKVIAFLHRPSGGVDLDASKYAGEIRFDPTTGYMRLGTSSTVTDGPITRFSISKDGKVGIGNLNTGNHKLAVEGSIGAREVKVEVSGWSDYVFYEDHDLPTLEEVENHILEKGHLINIPSANEVEENGIQLGQMNKLLLEKIEELTLYTLQQQKELLQQKEKNQSLEQRLAKLEKTINN